MVKIVEDRSETAFEDISVESDGEKVRLKSEIHSWFLRSFSREERGVS